MSHQSKFCIPKANQNTFSMPKVKVKDYSPIDYSQYFPNKEYLNDVKIKIKKRFQFIGEEKQALL